MARDKRTMNVQYALEWAFMTECAQLDLPDTRDVEDRGTGFGMEYVLIQRFRLGTHIDGGRAGPAHDTHEDAETIAAIVATLPETLDIGSREVRAGRRVAIAMAEYARSGITPDWMPGAVPKIEPREWGNPNQHGLKGRTEEIGVYIETLKVPHPRNRYRTITRKVERKISWTPCTWNPSQQEIDSARDSYLLWWHALDDIRLRLEAVQLHSIALNRQMPPLRPWATREALGVPAGGSRP